MINSYLEDVHDTGVIHQKYNDLSLSLQAIKLKKVFVKKSNYRNISKNIKLMRIMDNEYCYLIREQRFLENMKGLDFISKSRFFHEYCKGTGLFSFRTTTLTIESLLAKGFIIKGEVIENGRPYVGYKLK